ncbi:hypothetical protein SAMN05216315_10965 [Nitrosospira sp. Nsp18]|nr:hypothetical protein SAMN05216315_10965 [Nitrosospira sp. Nsp18]
MSLLFADKARREIMACFFFGTLKIAYPLFQSFPIPGVIYSVRNIMYFVTSSLNRNPTPVSNNVFCVPFDTDFHRFDVHNVACEMDSHE